MIKRFLFALALVLGTLSSVNAQDEAFKADALKLTKMSSGSAEASLEQVYNMIPAQKLDAFKKELQPVMEKYYEKIAIKSMEYYSHEDVKQLIAFYNSELGQKNLKVQAEMAKAATGSMAQELQRELMPIVQKYLMGG